MTTYHRPDVRHAPGEWKTDPERPNLVLGPDGAILFVASFTTPAAASNAIFASRAPAMFDCIQMAYARAVTEVQALDALARVAGPGQQDRVDRLAAAREWCERCRKELSYALGVRP